MEIGDKVRFKDESRQRIVAKIGPLEIGEIIALRSHESDGHRPRADIKFPSGDIYAILLSELEPVSS
jgi:hypothetical protein